MRRGRPELGHGDVAFAQIFDCIEFSTELRTLDKIDELAFLASECDHLGATWVGPQLMDRYQELTNDFAPPKLWNFYKSYRACVRAKIAALRAAQLSGQRGEDALREARAYLAQAQRHRPVAGDRRGEPGRDGARGTGGQGRAGAGVGHHAEVVAVEALLTDRGERIRDVRQGPDGAVYVLTDDSDGKLLRLIPKI